MQKYFRITQLLQAKIGHRPSHVWRSLCNSMELLKEGLFWQVGNGTYTKIWGHKWLPIPLTYPVQFPILDKDAMVCDLINESNGDWNRSLVY